MQVEVIDATWGRLGRVLWALAWRSAIVFFLLLMVIRLSHLMDLSRAIRLPIGDAMLALSLLATALIPLRLVVGRKLGDFRLALVREGESKDAAAFQASWWNRGAGQALSLVATGFIVIAAEYQTKSGDLNFDFKEFAIQLFILVVMLTAIVIASMVVHWLFLASKKEAGPSNPDA